MLAPRHFYEYCSSWAEHQTRTCASAACWRLTRTSISATDGHRQYRRRVLADAVRDVDGQQRGQESEKLLGGLIFFICPWTDIKEGLISSLSVILAYARIQWFQ